MERWDGRAEARSGNTVPRTPAIGDAELVAQAQHTKGLDALTDGDTGAAVRHLADAVVLWERAVGPGSARLVGAYADLATALDAAGRDDEAVPVLEHAASVGESALPAGDLRGHAAHAAELVSVLRRLGRHDDAVALSVRLAESAARDDAGGASHRAYLRLIAEVLAERGASWDAADAWVAWLKRAVPAGEDPEDLLDGYLTVARIAEALEELDAAIVIHEARIHLAAERMGKAAAAHARCWEDLAGVLDGAGRAADASAARVHAALLAERV